MYNVLTSSEKFIEMEIKYNMKTNYMTSLEH